MRDWTKKQWKYREEEKSSLTSWIFTVQLSDVKGEGGLMEENRYKITSGLPTWTHGTLSGDRKSRMRSRSLLGLSCVKGQVTQNGACHHTTSSGEDKQAMLGKGSKSHEEAGLWVFFPSVSYRDTCVGQSTVEYYIGLRSSGGSMTLHIYANSRAMSQGINVWGAGLSSPSLRTSYLRSATKYQISGPESHGNLGLNEALWIEGALNSRQVLLGCPRCMIGVLL